MASWADSPKPEDTDAMAYAEAWENRTPDVEYADEDETGQLGLGVPGEQRAMPGTAKAAVEAYFADVAADAEHKQAARRFGGQYTLDQLRQDNE